MEGDTESTPTTKVGQRKVTNQESGYARQRTDKQPAGLSADMSADEYGGARPKVKHPAQGKPKSFELFALNDIVSGKLFESPLPNSSTDIRRTGPARSLSEPHMVVRLHSFTSRRTLRLVLL